MTPEQDPSFSQVNGPTEDGNFEDVLLWAVGDSPDMFLMDAETPTNVTRLMTYARTRQVLAVQDQHGQPEVAAPEARARLVATRQARERPPDQDRRREAEHPVTEVRPTGPSGEEGTLIIHPGSTCRMIWNPATRRYTKVCTNP